VLLLLHIPFKMDACPLPRLAATAGPTATSAKDYLLRWADFVEGAWSVKASQGPLASSLDAEEGFTGWEVVEREVRTSAGQNGTTVQSYRRGS